MQENISFISVTRNFFLKTIWLSRINLKDTPILNKYKKPLLRFLFWQWRILDFFIFNIIKNERTNNFHTKTDMNPSHDLKSKIKWLMCCHCVCGVLYTHLCLASLLFRCKLTRYGQEIMSVDENQTINNNLTILKYNWTAYFHFEL